ncbi:MAG: type I-E CRISPR-associated protein Cas5/CasD [Mariprofundaceae bacterium]
MKCYLAIKLQGVMQAWGGHTYEDFRHSELIPTRSAVLGMLAACIGIDRGNIEQLESLSASVRMAVRLDSKPQRIMDFHTVLDARKVDGKPNPNPVVSKREYLCDAKYTVLIQSISEAGYSLESIEQAIKAPVYTPFLGRRSCLLSRPLFDEVISAIDFKQAFALIEPTGGVVYSGEKLHEDDALWRMRDDPVYARKRQFATRSIYIHAEAKEE